MPASRRCAGSRSPPATRWTARRRRSSRRSAPRRSPLTRSTSARRSPTMTPPHSSTCSPSRPDPPDVGSTMGSPRATCSTPGSRCSCAPLPTSSFRRRGTSSTRWRSRPAPTSTRCASAAPTASTPSRRRSESSSPALPSRPPATSSACARRLRRRVSARCPARLARTAPRPPTLAAGPAAARPRGRAGLDPGRGPGSACGAPPGDRARRRRA